MRICFTWDDGSTYDLKIMEIHKKFNVPAMFFIPNNNIEGIEVLSDNEIKKSLLCGLFSFGGHTENHTYLSTLALNQINYSLINNKKHLEEITGLEIKHFCFPGGDYNCKILKIVKNHFETYRTAKTMNFRRKKALVNPTIHFFNRGKKSLVFNCIKNFSIKEFFIILKNYKKNYFDILKLLIDKSYGFKKDIIVWGHGWELEKYDLWNELYSFIEYISSKYKECIVDYDTMLKGISNEK